MAIYYISNAGDDDTGDGSIGNPYATIAKVNSLSLNAGDSVLFNKVDVWRETLTVPSSGTFGSYITFGAYGTGDNPQILGSTQAITWTDQGGNIWRSATTVTDPYAPAYDSEIWFDESGTITWGTHVASTGVLTQEYDWVWDSDNIWVYAVSDPDSRYTSVEVPVRETAIALNSKEYIKIDGIDMFYLRTNGVLETYPTANLTGYILRNCHIAYLAVTNEFDCAGYGTHVVYNNSLIENNVIHDAGRRAISLYNYGDNDISNIIVQNNTFYSGNHTTGVDLSAGSIGSNEGNMSNVIIRYNLFYEAASQESPYSNHIFIKNVPAAGSTITDIWIYANIFKYPSGASVMLEAVGEAFIYNNTFYGTSQVNVNGSQHIYLNLGSTNITIKNNIFYTNTSYAVNHYSICIYIKNGGYSDVTADYNLYYTTDANQYIVLKYDAPQGLFHMNDWETLKSTSGWETNSSSPADPLFTDAPTDLTLAVGSPAIGTGINVGLTIDYSGELYNDPPSIGAYEAAVPFSIKAYINKIGLA